MGINLTNVKVVSSKAWENARGVKVSEVNINSGTLRTNNIMAFTFAPTRDKHDFMKKIGSTTYYMELTHLEKVIQVAENHWEIVNSIGKLIVELSDAQIAEWVDFAGKYVEFIAIGGRLTPNVIDDFDEWFSKII